ncbi:MAG: protein YgfX [Gammaproteobacteria bacterium]
MYAQYATPLRIDLQASRQAATWLLALHASGVTVLPLASLPLWGQAAGMLAAAASLWWHWLRHVSRRRSPVITFVWKGGSDCEVVDGDGAAVACTLAPRAFVMPWLVIIYYHTGARHRSLFILPDMLPADTFRRLRVRLKTELGQVRPLARTCGRTS